MVDCTLFVDFTPPDVIDWLVAFHNRWHDGMQTHFLALLLRTPKIFAGWSTYRTLQGIGAREGKGGKSSTMLCTEWLLTQKEAWDSGTTLEDANALMKTLSQLNIDKEFRFMLRDLCLFKNPRINNNAVVQNIHAFITTLTLHFAGAMSNSCFLACFLEGVKYMVPVGSKPDSTYDTRPTPWAFEVFSEKAINVIKTGMGESKVFTKPAKAKAATKAKPTPKKATKRPGGAKSAVAHIALPEEDMCKDVEVFPGNDEDKENSPPAAGSASVNLTVKRANFWLDDLVGTVEFAIGHCREHLKSDDAVDKLRRILINIGMEFAWTSQVSVGGKVYKNWTNLRDELKSMVTKFASSKQVPPELQNLSDVPKVQKHKPSEVEVENVKAFLMAALGGQSQTYQTSQILPIRLRAKRPQAVVGWLMLMAVRHDVPVCLGLVEQGRRAPWRMRCSMKMLTAAPCSPMTIRSCCCEELCKPKPTP
jgi:hypothetical protein